MFVILVYDIGEKRVGKVLKTTRKYLYHVQNSVFEGEISEENLKMLKKELFRKINKEEDSIIIYKFRSTKYYDREIHGVEKGGESLFL